MPHGFNLDDELPQKQKDHWDPFVQVRAVLVEDSRSGGKSWRPVTLRTPFLTCMVAITLALIGILQVITIRSGRDDGLFFAPRISDLDQGRTFLYLYLPTVLSVLYSLVWTWVDLDTKRIEPYRQLSRAGGAIAEDSLLLHYPSDFLAFVPLKSLRRRHWPVFISSCVLVLVAWSITPLQAAIFATKTVTRSFDNGMLLSTKYLDIHEQAATVTSNYTYSVFGMTWLGERLPAYMSRDAAFAPFQPAAPSSPEDSEIWTASTTQYSVDVTCENATLSHLHPHEDNNDSEFWMSSQGCKVPYQMVGYNPFPQGEEFSSFYAGFQNYDGYAQYYISMYCPDDAIRVFLVAFQQQRSNATQGGRNVLFCEPTYYQQNVTATVRQSDRNVVKVSDGGPKLPVPTDMFNVSQLEWQMNSEQQEQIDVRGSVPGFKWPDQLNQLTKYPINLNFGLTMMAGLAIGTTRRPLEEYMNFDVLQDSYQSAYRLMFARAMVDVLKPEFDSALSIKGSRTYETQAVYVVEGFAYAVEGILGAVAVLGFALLVYAWEHDLALQADPGSLTAMMALVSGQEKALGQLMRHDRSTPQQLHEGLATSRYRIRSQSGGKAGLDLINSTQSFSSPTAIPRDSSDSLPNSPDYPTELKRTVGIAFLLALLATTTAIVYLYRTGAHHGLALPSQNRFVRQMLENYIPTIIATLIEPVWVVINRLLCTIQPFEALRAGDAPAKRSVDLNYASLPPQLVLPKAVKARHVLLAAVCSAALLANVLAVAFSGMFNEDYKGVATQMEFSQPYRAMFLGNVSEALEMPGIANNKMLTDHFCAAKANLTSDTPMPVWTDARAFYLPLSIESSEDGSADANDTDSFRAPTRAFASELECVELGRNPEHTWSMAMHNNTGEGYVQGDLIVTVPDDELGTLTCFVDTDGTRSTVDVCSNTRMAYEVVKFPDAADNATQAQKQACRQSVVGLWARKTARDLCDLDHRLHLGQDDATVMYCKTKITSRAANVTFARDGHVQRVESTEPFSADVGTYFSSDSRQLAREANGYLMPASWLTWHDDAFASDWNNYIMSLISPASGILDPALPPPDFHSTAALLGKAYSKAFAIWLGMKHDKLLLRPLDNDTATVQGSITRQQRRILVSETMVVLALVILGSYVLVAVAVYVRQPGRFLPRLPTSMASCIGMFAASRAVEEFAEVSEADKGGFFRWAGDREVRFGYGKYLGTDGRVHVGVERKPFVTAL